MGQAWSESGEVPTELVLAVMTFLPWEDRFRVLLLNRYFASLGEDDSLWQWMALQLTHDYVFVPTVPTKVTWKETFSAFFPMRRRWRTLLGTGLDDRIHFRLDVPEGAMPDDAELPDEDEGAAAGEADEDAPNRYSINVSVRFRPVKLPRKLLPGEVAGAAAEDGEDGEAEDKENADARAIIPLHQRLQMLQAQHRCSPATARKLLWARTSDTFDPWAGAILAEAHAANGAGEAGAGTTVPAPAPARDARADAEPALKDGDMLPSTIRIGVLSVQPPARQVLLCAPR
jgi:hypothetical protein